MSYTAGQVSDKISELRGRITVFQKLREQIRNNYLPSDGGAPELKMARSDGMPVTTSHFRAVLEDLQEKVDQLNEELQQWEEMVFGPSQIAEEPEVVDVEPAEDTEDEEADTEDAFRVDETPIVPLKKNKEKNRGKARRSGSHQSATK